MNRSLHTDIDFPLASALADSAWQSLGGASPDLAALSFTRHGALSSAFAVTDMAAAAVGVAGLALAKWLNLYGLPMPEVLSDRRLASFWFAGSMRPQGWASPPLWDAVAGDYPGVNGWIRLHTNAPHHRAAALRVLGGEASREAVSRAVAGWDIHQLEAAIVAEQGCAAAMRSQADWADHPQGRAVAAEPLIAWAYHDVQPQPSSARKVTASRPLQGIRVLDLTRILAGPTATRFLAGYGADVLRIDPPGWEEPGTVPEVVLGKRCARLDLKQPQDKAIWESLLREADILIHGYRPDALIQLGLGPERRRELNPCLIDISLDAYGWAGPWQGRRGFDSLVQMSTGIAHTGMMQAGAVKPIPLPVQALDHATGYLMAAAALRALTRLASTNQPSTAKLSLARTARWLTDIGIVPVDEPLAVETATDVGVWDEHSGWGLSRRLHPPVSVSGSPMRWNYPASRLGSSPAGWL